MDQQSEECKTPVRDVAQQYEEQEGLRPNGVYIGLLMGNHAEQQQQNELQQMTVQDAQDVRFE